MKIPEYISQALQRRTRAAFKFFENDHIIAEWLEKHDLYDNVENYDICGGCESLLNPAASEQRIREVILQNE